MDFVELSIAKWYENATSKYISWGAHTSANLGICDLNE